MVSEKYVRALFSYKTLEQCGHIQKFAPCRHESSDFALEESETSRIFAMLGVEN
jgi:hypothetical protein